MLPPGRGAGGAAFAAGGLRGFDEAGDLFGNVVVDVFFILSAGGIQRANLALQVFQLRLQRLDLRRRGIRGLIGLTGAHVALQLAELIFRRIEAIVHASQFFAQVAHVGLRGRGRADFFRGDTARARPNQSATQRNGFSKKFQKSFHAG